MTIVQQWIKTNAKGVSLYFYRDNLFTVTVKFRAKIFFDPINLIARLFKTLLVYLRYVHLS